MSEDQDFPRSPLYELRLVLDSYRRQALRWLDSEDDAESVTNQVKSEVTKGDSAALKNAAESLAQGMEAIDRFGDTLHPELLASITSILHASFVVGDRLGVSGSTKRYFDGKNTSKSRRSKEEIDQIRIGNEEQVLRAFTAGRVIKHPFKFVEGHLKELSEAAERAKLKPPSQSTWLKRMKDIGHKSVDKKFNT